MVRKTYNNITGLDSNPSWSFSFALVTVVVNSNNSFRLSILDFIHFYRYGKEIKQNKAVLWYFPIILILIIEKCYFNMPSKFQVHIYYIFWDIPQKLKLVLIFCISLRQSGKKVLENLFAHCTDFAAYPVPPSMLMWLQTSGLHPTLKGGWGRWGLKSRYSIVIYITYVFLYLLLQKMATGPEIRYICQRLFFLIVWVKFKILHLILNFSS